MDENRAIELDSSYNLAYFDRGQIHSRKGEYDQAISDFTEIINRTPDAATYSSRAYAYLLKGDYDHAIEDSTRAIGIRPGDYAYVTRGMAYYFKADYGNALLDANSAIKLAPDYDYAHYLLGLIDRAKGQIEQARAEFQIVISKSKDPGLLKKSEEQLSMLAIK